MSETRRSRSNARFAPARFPFLGTLLLLLIPGCGDDGSGPDPVDNTVSSVSVTPNAHSFDFLRATVQLGAEARNSAGDLLVGIAFTWGSSEPAVATVSATGLVEAVSDGLSIITATASGTSVSASIQVTVQQTPTSVLVGPQDGSVEVGETLQMTATALDRGGAEISGASFLWSSSDQTVATVTQGGLVTGIAAGPVTIQANSGAGIGSAPVTVLRQDIEITQDTNLQGTVEADEFRIPAGVTVTLTGALTVDATGYVEILGSMVGACQTLTIQGDTAVTVKGTLDNGCAAGEAGADLSVQSDGELTLEDATIISSGDVSFSNDPTLTETDFPEPGPSGAPRGTQAQDPRRAGAGVPYTYVNRTTVRYKGGGAGPYPAKGGASGTSGTDAESGRPVKMWLRGNAEFAGNTLLWGQDGGQGGNGSNTAVGDVVSTGGKGGDGGRIRVFITGTLTYSGNENVVRSGSGGGGGDAIARALPSDVGSKAPGATATGGAGGIPGLIEIRAGAGVEVAEPGALVLEIGIPGAGGDASATGVDGRDAQSATVPAQDGGDATSTGGEGGSTPDKQLLKQGNVTGSNPIIRGTEAQSPDGGLGGDATSTAGRGGNGIQVNKNGGMGGAISATGGAGGHARIKGLGAEIIGDGGDGGKAWFFGGNGGTGWSDCQVGQPTEAGGNGGAGGSSVGDQGQGGQGATPGSGGGTHFENVGNGGDGGDGEPQGASGPKGSKGAVTGESDVVQPAFQDGVPGAQCPPPTPPERVYLQMEGFPNNGGYVDPGSATLFLLDSSSFPLGFTSVETVGPKGGHFVKFNPDRWGYFGEHGWKVFFDGMMVGGKSFELLEFEVCYYNTEVTALNPALIQQVDADGVVTSTTEVGSLTSPPQGGAARVGEGGANCRSVLVDPSAVAFFLKGPLDMNAEVGGAEGRPGIGLYGYRHNN